MTIIIKHKGKSVKSRSRWAYSSTKRSNISFDFRLYGSHRLVTRSYLVTTKSYRLLILCTASIISLSSSSIVSILFRFFKTHQGLDKLSLST